MSRVLPARPALTLAALAGMVLCLLVGLAGPAAAGPWVDRTAGQLRDAPLYVNPSARPTLSLVDRERIRPGWPWPARPCSWPSCRPRRWPRPAATPTTWPPRSRPRSAGPGPTWWSPGPRRGRAATPWPGRGRQPGRGRVPGAPGAGRGHLRLHRAGRGRGRHHPGHGPAGRAAAGPGGLGGNTVLLVLLAVAGWRWPSARPDAGEPLGAADAAQRLQLSEAKATAQEDLDALASDLRNLNVDLQAEEAGNAEAVNQYTRAYEPGAGRGGVRPGREAGRPGPGEQRARVGPVRHGRGQGAVRARRPAAAAAALLLRHPPRASVHDVGWEPPGARPGRCPPAGPACAGRQRRPAAAAADPHRPAPRALLRRPAALRVVVRGTSGPPPTWSPGSRWARRWTTASRGPQQLRRRATRPSPTPTRAYSTAVVLSRESRPRTAARSPSRRTPMRTSRPAHGSRPPGQALARPVAARAGGDGPDRRPGGGVGGGRRGRPEQGAGLRGPGRRDAGLARPAPVRSRRGRHANLHRHPAHRRPRRDRR